MRDNVKSGWNKAPKFKCESHLMLQNYLARELKEKGERKKVVKMGTILIFHIGGHGVTSEVDISLFLFFSMCVIHNNTNTYKYSPAAMR